MERKETGRQYHLDWLRVLALATIFIFHNARYFDYGPWHVKNGELSFGIQVFVGFTVQWIMPLFFILSAISMYYSLENRDISHFLTERCKRLAVPFVFGCLIILVPIQVWIERVTQANYKGSFITFWFGDYFDGLYGFGGNFAWMGLHLWYLEYLFLFSLVALPVFLLLRNHAGGRLAASYLKFANKPGMIFLWTIPIVAMELLVNLQPHGIGMRNAGGWSGATYLVIFFIGFIIAMDKSFLANMVKMRFISLMFGIIFSGCVLYFHTVKSDAISFYVMKYAIGGFNMWLWLIAILGFGTCHLNFNNRFLQYANELVMPFYVLHQTIIVVIGYALISVNLPISLKYLILAISSFFTIMIIYELVVKRFNALRMVFGMKVR